MTIFASLANISWFYAGIENFKIISFTSAVVQTFSVVMVILLVHSPSDLTKYFVIASLNILITQLIQWLFLIGKISLVRVPFNTLVQHVKQALRYFLVQVSISLYTTLNKVLLGLLTTVTIVAYYSNALALATIVVTVVGVVDTVLQPRLSHMYAENRHDDMAKVIIVTIHTQLFFTVPGMLGVAAISTKFVPWFFGEQFTPVIYASIPLSCVIILIPLSVSIAKQFLIPADRLRSFNLSVIVAAVVGIILNFVLIPYFSIWGAVISTILSEFVVAVVRIVDLRRSTSFRFHVRFLAGVFGCGTLMAAVVFLLTRGLSPTPLTTIIQVLLGVSIYGAATFILRVNPFHEFGLRFRSGH